MATDAGRYGLSQRYFTSGLHAAHTAGDRAVGTYLLADMSMTRVTQGRLNDGVDLGRAAPPPRPGPVPWLAAPGHRGLPDASLPDG